MTWRFHWNRDMRGYICSTIVLAYWIYGTIVPMKMIIIPYYMMGIVRTHAVIMYMFFSIMTMASLIRSVFFHPGRIPTYTGSSAQADWEHCDKCNTRRPPRAHHCRRCGHCVTLMDHHCPWINNCVGADNRFAFLLLIFYTIGLSFSALAFCFTKSYKFPPCPPQLCHPESFFVIHERGLLITSYILSALMAFGMTMMSCGQHMSIALDVTTLESMITKDPVGLLLSRPERPLKYRYDQLCGTKTMLLWFLPCRRKPTVDLPEYGDPNIV